VSCIGNNCSVHMANVWGLQQNIEKYLTCSSKTLMGLPLLQLFLSVPYKMQFPQTVFHCSISEPCT
jgi:hypothetical protein